jgi:hypothetical protein
MALPSTNHVGTSGTVPVFSPMFQYSHLALERFVLVFVFISSGVALVPGIGSWRRFPFVHTTAPELVVSHFAVLLL